MSWRNRIHVGTSGWHYDHWQGPFYPDDLPPVDWLSYYADRFDTVEINNTFYQLPARATLERWRATGPDGFCFAVKASRYITHMKKLKDPQEPLSRLYSRIEALGDALGPVLFQLPPRWRFDLERLEAFLQALAPDLRHVFEFRDPSWFDERTYDLLAAHDAGFCVYHLAGTQAPHVVTGGCAYIRLHGPDAAYQGSYAADALGGWAGALSAWARQGLPVYCYFDNDESGYAPQNASALRRMLRSPS